MPDTASDAPATTRDTQYVTRATSFDRVAADYDRSFTDTPLARRLREAVWARLAAHFQPGMRVLEVGCGTGEDAVWLAQRGVRVIATDASPAMLEVTRQKARRADVADKVEARVLDAAAPFTDPLHVDGAFSNFGALNCVNDLRPLATALAGWLPPGGNLILVFINRWCAWEIFWHWIHLQPRVALRRLRRDGVEARVGEGMVHTWYPSLGSIRRAFAPDFKLKRVIGLGVFLPPSYLAPVVTRRPRLFQTLARLEDATAARRSFRSVADHVILELVRGS